MDDFISVGQFRCLLLDGGSFRVDGGAMFGVVPRALWEKKVTPDEANRVPLVMSPLLILAGKHKILVDPGMGSREIERFGEHYHIRCPNTIDAELAKAGLHADDIDIVINTHLHWDHSGANVRRLSPGHIAPAFPKAAYYVQEGEWEAASNPNELTRGSYLMQADDSLVRSGQLALVRGDREILPGVRLMTTPGHTPHHQSVCVESGDEALFYLGDIIPTTAHLPLPYITSLDLEPAVTLETKRRILKQARQGRWSLAFCHEPGEKILRIWEQD
jgi:glyoxylase-like metal-dependent hydrolase (beta-lactamase superfamily II)